MRSSRRRRGRPVTFPAIQSLVGDDDSWGRRVIPRGWLTTRDLARMLDVGRHQARRILVASPLPRQLFRRPWLNPDTGAFCTREVWGLPFEAAHVLLADRMDQYVRRLSGLRLLPLRREQRRARDLLGRWMRENPKAQ